MENARKENLTSLKIGTGLSQSEKKNTSEK
jgi:hypothetical protein